MIQRRPGSAAGNWLFCNRRWLDPADPADRARLHAGYDALLSLFPAALTEVPRALFIEHLSEVTTAWADVARDSFSRRGRQRTALSELSCQPTASAPSDPPRSASSPPLPAEPFSPMAVAQLPTPLLGRSPSARSSATVDPTAPAHAVASGGWCWWGRAIIGTQAAITQDARLCSVDHIPSPPPKPPSSPPPSSPPFKLPPSAMPLHQPEQPSAFQRVPPRSRPDWRGSGPSKAPLPASSYFRPPTLATRLPAKVVENSDTRADGAPGPGLILVAPTAEEEGKDFESGKSCWQTLARPGGGREGRSATAWPAMLLLPPPPLPPGPPALALHAVWSRSRQAGCMAPWATGNFPGPPQLGRRWARAPALAPWAPMTWPLTRDAAAAATAATATEETAWVDWR